MTLFGSLYPTESITGLSTSTKGLPPLTREIKTIPEFMKELGYRTLATTGGGYVDSTWQFDQGFEQYWNHGDTLSHS